MSSKSTDHPARNSAGRGPGKRAARRADDRAAVGQPASPSGPARHRGKRRGAGADKDVEAQVGAEYLSSISIINSRLYIRSSKMLLMRFEKNPNPARPLLLSR